MKKATKIWLIVAAALVITGALVFTGVMASLGFNFVLISTPEYALKTYEVADPFTDMAIDVTTTDITLAPSPNGQCRVECMEEDGVSYDVSVENGTLYIRFVDDRQWLDHIGIHVQSPKMTVYLPREQYDSLSINVTTSNVSIPSGFRFEALSITGTTANVDCLATVDNGEIRLTTGYIQWDALSAGDLRLVTTTGNIFLNISTAGDIQCTTQTGNMELTGMACQSLNALSNTGNIALNLVTADSYIAAECSAGNIRLQGCDAGELYLRTTTGNVTGQLLTEKEFITDTSTGNVEVPNTTGGDCQIITTTGNIHMEIIP